MNPSRTSSAELRFTPRKPGYGLRAVPFLLFFLFFPFTPLAAQEKTYLTEILGKAEQLKLAEDPYWHTLLHYKPRLFGGWESRVDDPRFFFAEDGKTNPEAELRATLEAFFLPVREGTPHATTKFAGRYDWLRKKLDLDPTRLPYDGDKNFLKFKAEIKPGSAHLVFPAGYMNSPASMFGHTFLLVEAEGGSRLLAHSVNYAAITDDKFGPLFAFRGLFGLYKGYYSFLPYYQKVREYGDAEMRDMWEYELDFSVEELDRLLRHIVEMEEIYSDYYFVGENCSYNLLFLIEAARPETRITEAFGPVVEPIETIKVAKRLGLVKNRVYRPSLYARIQYEASLLSEEENRLVRDFSGGEIEAKEVRLPGRPEETQAVFWDLAADYLKFLATKGRLTEAEYRKRFLAALSARQKLGKFDVFRNLGEPPPPEVSHDSRKIGVETGTAPRGPYSDLSFRLTAHEAMDADEGYTRNSEIVFGQAALRYRWEEHKVTLRRFDLIDLVSLPASDAYFFGACYQLKTGLFMNGTEDREEALSYRLKGSTGLSTLLGKSVQIYGFVGLDAFFSPAYTDGKDLLFGGEVGLYTVLGRWKNHLSAKIERAPFPPVHTRWEAAAEERLELTRALALSCFYSRKGDYRESWNEAGLRINFYF